MRHPYTLLMLLLTLPAAVAQAGTALTAVGHYDRSAEAEVWRQASPYDVPEALLEVLQVDTPSRAYTYPFPNVFLQNEHVIVCESTCDGPQSAAPRMTGPDTYTLGPTGEGGRAGRARDEAVLRQATVYYWVNRVFDRFEQLGHHFQHRLEVYVDRDIQDPETGQTLTNNAFFLSTQVDVAEWSLSFLPSERGMGMNFLPSAWDPSVAMHEATHFVFQEMVGDILNREVYGLHEAFADYFAMAVLDSPDIGQVMMRGEPLRSARQLLRYEPNMEVHDLGNVVVAALWNIRDRFPDKDAADRVVFHTIRNIGDNPFAAAGEVVEAYYAALEVEGKEALQSTPGLMGEIDRIWQATELKGPMVTPNLEVLTTPIGPEEGKKAVTVSIQINTPDEAVLAYGLPPVQKDTVTLITARPGPSGSGYTWFMVALQDLDSTTPMATPFWILYAPGTGIIRYAYTIGGELVTVHSDLIDEYRRLITLNEQLATLLDYAQSFGAEMTPLAHRRGKWASLKTRRVEILDSFFRYGYPGRLIPMHVYRADVRPTFGGWLVSLLGAPQIRATDEVWLYTVDRSALDTTRLPAVGEGEILVGYEVVKKTGFKVAVRLEDLGEAR